VPNLAQNPGNATEIHLLERAGTGRDGPFQKFNEPGLKMYARAQLYFLHRRLAVIHLHSGSLSHDLPADIAPLVRHQH